MAYVEVSEGDLNHLELSLNHGSRLAKAYHEARDAWHRFQDGYQEAHQKFETARKAVADYLLDVMAQIDSIENHKKGQAW